MILIRKLIIALLGGGLLAIGVAMIVLPGPAILVIPLALAILAPEFEFAQRWQTRFRERIRSIVRRKSD